MIIGVSSRFLRFMMPDHTPAQVGLNGLAELMSAGHHHSNLTSNLTVSLAFLGQEPSVDVGRSMCILREGQGKNTKASIQRGRAALRTMAQNILNNSDVTALAVNTKVSANEKNTIFAMGARDSFETRELTTQVHLEQQCTETGDRVSCHVAVRSVIAHDQSSEPGEDDNLVVRRWYDIYKKDMFIRVPEGDHTALGCQVSVEALVQYLSRP